MTQTNKGRCVECGLIPRPDMAAAKGEDHCKCDPLFNKFFKRWQQMLAQVDEDIEDLAARINNRPRKSQPLETETDND